MIALAPTAHSVGVARRFVAGVLDSYDVILRDTVVLLVSELVTNAIEHGGPHSPTATVGLEVETDENLVRVVVSDSGLGEPLAGDGSVHLPSGRGLLLVQTLASRWGCDRQGVGKTVWFEVVVPPAGDIDG